MMRLHALALFVLAVASSLTAAYGAKFPVTVVDDFGRPVVIPGEPLRVVCQGPSCTEIVYALGALDRVVAVDPFSDYPPEVAFKAKVGASGLGYIKLYASAEDFLSLNPDLIITYSYVEAEEASATILPQLEALGLKVIVLKPHTIEDVLNDILLVGRALGVEDRAERLVSELRARISLVEEALANVSYRPRVYVEYWYPPPWTFGPDTWPHQLIELAGGVNVFSDAPMRWVESSDEEVIARDPEVIVSLVGPMHNASLEDFRRRPGWSEVTAVVRGAVYQVDEDLLVRPGPRLVEGLEVLARVLHPEVFGEVRRSQVRVDVGSIRRGLTPYVSLSLDGASYTSIVAWAVAPVNFTLTLIASRVGPSLPQGLKPITDYVEARVDVAEASLRQLVAVRYDEASLRRLGLEEGSLRLYAWVNGSWEPMPTLIDRERDLLVALVEGPSLMVAAGTVVERGPRLEWPVMVACTAVLVGVACYVAGYLRGRRRR